MFRTVACGGNLFANIYEADVRITTTYRWTAGGGSYPCAAGSAFYLDGVSAHEFGHVIGLCHVNQASSLMYPSFGACESKTKGSDETAGETFANSRPAEDAMKRLGVEFGAMDRQSSLQAGIYWKKYRRSGGKRIRIISDFLIGSHAWNHADRLLSRDRGFYRRYFSRLALRLRRHHRSRIPFF